MVLLPLAHKNTKNIVVWRGNTLGPEKLDYIKQFQNNGYVFVNQLTSTAPDLNTAFNFSGLLSDYDNTSVFFKIHLNKRMSIIDFDEVLKNRVFYGEKEILLLPFNQKNEQLQFILKNTIQFPSESNPEVNKIAKKRFQYFINQYQSELGYVPEFLKNSTYKDYND